MNLSAILVVVPPEHLDPTAQRLGTLDGVTVHHTDPATGRMIVVQEAETIDREVEGLQRIQALPHIILAELVEHHFEDDAEINEVGDIPRPGDSVPRRLQD